MGHDPWSELREVAEGVRRSIESALHVKTPGTLEEAPEGRGLFALATHPWAKELKASPADIAARGARVRAMPPFEPLRAEGPYVNFRVDAAAFSELVLASVRLMGDRYGTSPARSERILLEHTSVNPTGPLHVGRARNPLLGDSLGRLVAGLTRLGITFDSFFWESDLILDRSVHRVIERLLPLSKEEDGAHYLDLSGFGLEGDAAKYFFVTRRGTSLYTTRDLAYHLRKMEQCDRAINVLGEDQKLSFQRLKATFQLMGIEWAPETIYYAFVSLPEGRMSTRKGIVVFVDDLIDEAIERAFAEVSRRREDLSEPRRRAIAETIGLGALRYNIVRVQAEKAITFRWEDALNFEGNSAPFLQYAHARACSILAKAGDMRPGDPRLLLHPQEQRLLRWIAKFPSTVRDAADSRRVHVVASFASDFASQFNQFYRDCPVLTAEPPALRDARASLVDAARIVLHNGLDCLGVTAPREM